MEKALSHPYTIWGNVLFGGLPDPEWDTTLDDVYVHPEKEHKFIDRWREPTDGSWKITSKDIKQYFDSGEYSRRHGNYRVKGKNRVKK